MLASIWALPDDADEVAFLVVMSVEMTFVCVENGMSNAAGQVDVGGRNDYFAVSLVDTDDPLKRMIGALGLLSVPRKRDNLVLMSCKKAAAQDNFAGRIVIVGSMTGRAQLL